MTDSDLQNELTFEYREWVRQSGFSADQKRIVFRNAQFGYADSQKLAGRLLQAEGRHSEAASMYAKAIQGGAKEAAFDLARLKQTGIGVDRNPQEAVKLFGMAADAGVVTANFHLGCLLITLNRHVEAVWALKQAEAAGGEIGNQASVQLCIVYRDGGIGIKPDSGRALVYLRRAARAGNPEAKMVWASEIEESDPYAAAVEYASIIGMSRSKGHSGTNDIFAEAAQERLDRLTGLLDYNLSRGGKAPKGPVH